MTELPEVKPNYAVPNLGGQTRAEDIFGKFKTGQIKNLFPTVTSVPTAVPKVFWEQIQIYINVGSGTFRLYVYDSISVGWRYTTLT